jgi:hypothetical protein
LGARFSGFFSLATIFACSSAVTARRCLLRIFGQTRLARIGHGAGQSDARRPTGDSGDLTF